MRDSGPSEERSERRKNLWNWRVVLLFAAVLSVVGLITWFIQLTTDSTRRARTAIDEFHHLYHADDYLSIYSASHPTLQRELTRDDARLRLSQVRTKLGNVVDMSFGCITHRSKESTVLVRIEYRVTFAGGEAWETYDWRFDRDEARLMAYAVETGFEDGKPDWEISLAPRGIRPNATTCTRNEQRHWWEEKRQLQDLFAS